MARLLDRVEREADAWKTSGDPSVRSCGEWLSYLLDHGMEPPEVSRSADPQS
jgi:hypothetical protein